MPKESYFGTQHKAKRHEPRRAAPSLPPPPPPPPPPRLSSSFPRARSRLSDRRRPPPAHRRRPALPPPFVHGANALAAARQAVTGGSARRSQRRTTKWQAGLGRSSPVRSGPDRFHLQGRPPLAARDPSSPPPPSFLSNTAAGLDQAAAAHVAAVTVGRPDRARPRARLSAAEPTDSDRRPDPAAAYPGSAAFLSLTDHDDSEHATGAPCASLHPRVKMSLSVSTSAGATSQAGTRSRRWGLNPFDAATFPMSSGNYLLSLSPFSKKFELASVGVL